MKKAILVILTVLALTFTLASAQERDNPWNSTDIKIQIAETFSDRADGTIIWDDESSGYWTGSIFFAWPEAEWRGGQLVMTNALELEDSRMTFRIQTSEMPRADIGGSIGIGFYIENNTKYDQSVGFYMIGSSSCLKNKNGTKLIFVDLYGNITQSVVTDDSMAIVPAGAKGYVIGYYDDFMNLWSSDAYSPDKDKISMPGFELTKLIIDGEEGETVIIDNVFYFGTDCADNNSEGIIARTFLEPDPTPTVEPTPAPTKEPGEEQTQPAGNGSVTVEDNSLIVYILSGVIFLTSLVAAFIIIRKK
ncbi:MAG: hypothetical protein IKK58_04930 [Clostridia bacterium]|nr:hypothetical protein [Clostridia bacterium]